jgi:[protein-PII] uridylyltransferase
MTPAEAANHEAGCALSDLDQRLADAADPLAPFRNALKEGSQRLGAQFDQGVPVTALVAAHSGLVDEILRRCWHLKIPARSTCGLVAVGGYGRGELHPGSDIDILILLDDEPSAAIYQPIEQFLMFLWDIGLEVGHSVRSIADCVNEAKQDITVITNLVEARLLAGPEALFARMQTAIAPDKIWPSDAFFEAKWQEQKARWKKYGDTAYNLEPNIKENPGGLRDIQMIGWVCRRHFGTRTLHELVHRGFLTEQEYHALMDGQALLWKIRYGLHRLTGRREDRLLFDFQRTLATRFGYTDQDHNLAVEQLMQRYYRTVMELNRLNEMLMQLFHEAIIMKCHLDPPQPINRRFQSRSGFLETTHNKVFEYYPAAMLEVFLLMQTRPELKGVRASTIRQIRTHLPKLDDDVRQDIRARSLFMEILRQPVGITTELRRMNAYGVLAAYIPAFDNIVGRMQYDLFHVYTVDAHTLFVLRNLRRFLIPEHSHEFPLCSAIAHTLPKPELLFLAGLFHDIAKGRGGDHSVLGAQDAWAFCHLHGLSEYDSRLVAWLVEQHLIMSMTAQRQDISDTEVIQAFAAHVGDTTRLDYLYLLTVADSRATNPRRWNSWKDSLLKELYHATRHTLLRGLDNPQAQDELVQQKQGEALRLLEMQGIEQQRAIRLWLTFSFDFFLHNSPAEIAWQSRLMLETPDADLPLASIRPETERGCTEVFLYTWDADNLFAWSTALLDQLGLHIMDARIMTTDDAKALNLYLLLDEDGSQITELQRQQEIINALVAGIREPSPIQPRVSRRIPRQHKHFETETRISFYPDTANNRTLMRLVTSDRPGLLADVGYAFSACDIRLHNAKIATVGEAVEDIFFITNHSDQPITDEAQRQCLHDNLLQRINQSVNGDPTNPD